MRGLNIVFVILLGVLTWTSSVNAETKRVNRLTGVEFNSGPDAFEFAFVAKRHAFDPQHISAHADGEVLNLRLEQTRTKRRWIDTDDPDIRRTYLHPSARREPAAVLRIRLKRAISDAVLRNIVVRAEGRRLIAAIPRSEKIAARWASQAKTPAKEAVETPVAQPEAKTTAESKKAPEAATSTTDTEAVAAAPESEETLLVLPSATDTTKAEGEDAEALPAGLAHPDPKGPSLGAIGMSVLFLMAIGIVLWRRMRPANATSGNGRLIKPIGSHILGPKHRLLLVDVAGQLVLLGSHEKGVQMLTTIPRNDDVTASEDEVPLDAMPEAAATGASFADRLGRAVVRMRDAARGRLVSEDNISDDDCERDFFRREKEAVREAAEEDALTALADGVTDTADVGRERIRRAAARATRKEKREETGSSSILEQDLLQKIRRLQRA